MSGKPKKKAASPDAGKKKKKKEARSKDKGSPKSSKQDEKTKQQLQELSAELVLARGRVEALEADQHQREAELQAVRAKQEADSLNYGDVLHHQQREQHELQQHVRKLEQTLQAAQRQVEGLESELQAAKDEPAAAEEDGPGAQGFKRMASAARHKDLVIAQQEAELAQLRDKLELAHSNLHRAHEQIEDLKYKASSRSQLMFLFDEHCMARIDRHRLTGKLPQQQPSHVLCCVGGQWLVQYGTVATAGSVESVVSVLDMLTGQWQAACVEPCSRVLAGHAVVGTSNRMVAFGGSSGDELLGGLRLFSPSAMAWVPLPPRGISNRGPVPCPRKGHAMAFCGTSNSVFLWGGCNAQRQLLGDLWRLCLDTFEWSQLKCLPSPQVQELAASSKAAAEEGLPKPCCSAALAVSEDGARLWLSGGSTAQGKCQNTLWCYELGLGVWSLAELAADSLYVEPREGHVMTCVGRWLLVAGGSCKQSTGERKLLGDTLVFDTLVGAWDSLDANCWAPAPARKPSGRGLPRLASSASVSASFRGGLPRVRMGSIEAPDLDGGPAGAAGEPRCLGAFNCTLAGSSLLVLKESMEGGGQGELQVVQLSLVDEVARRRMAKRASLVVIPNLELLDGADVTPTSIRVAWLAPTKNAHKLVGFKLMITGEDDGVREVYEGKERCFEVQRLTPNTEYILAVKAIYDDATFVWSESKAFRTLMKSKAYAQEPGAAAAS